MPACDQKVANEIPQSAQDGKGERPVPEDAAVQKLALGLKSEEKRGTLRLNCLTGSKRVCKQKRLTQRRDEYRTRLSRLRSVSGSMPEDFQVTVSSTAMGV